MIGLSEKRAQQIRFSLLGVLLGACLWAGRHGGGGDFFVLRNSVIAAWSGNFSGVYLRESSGPFFYPPFALVFFGFFSTIANEHFAILVNVLLHTASFVAFWWGLRQLFPILFTARHFWHWFFCFCFSIAPLHLDFMGQNINLPLAAFLLSIEVVRRRGGRRTQFVCGLLSALLAWIKVFPGFVTVSYFLKGSRELRWGIILGIGLGFALPLVVFGKGGMFLSEEFITTLQIYHDKNGITGSYALSLPGLVARWGSYFISPNRLSAVTATVTIVAALLFLVWVRIVREESARDFEPSIWSLSIGFMAFLNSAARPDYFMFYVPLFSLLLIQWEKLHVGIRFVVGTSFCFIALTQQAIVGRELNIDFQHLRLPVVGMAMLFWAEFTFRHRNSKIVS